MHRQHKDCTVSIALHELIPQMSAVNQRPPAVMGRACRSPSGVMDRTTVPMDGTKRTVVSATVC